MSRRRRSLALFALMLAGSCGGKLLDDEPLARTTTGTREGDDRRPPPDEPTLVPIVTAEPDLEPTDASADSGCSCGAIEGHLAHLGADRDCHDPGVRFLACRTVATDAACAPEPSAGPSCLESIGTDGSVELFWAASTWGDLALSIPKSTASIKSCDDGGAVLATAACL